MTPHAHLIVWQPAIPNILRLITLRGTAAPNWARTSRAVRIRPHAHTTNGPNPPPQAAPGALQAVDWS